MTNQQPPADIVKDTWDADEIWDKHSEYMDDNSFSFERFAGSDIMRKEDFLKAVQPLTDQLREAQEKYKAELTLRLEIHKELLQLQAENEQLKKQL